MNRRKDSAVSNDNSRPTGAQYLTVAQVADRWACARTVVYREIEMGRLRALQLGSQTKRVSQAEVARYERERTGVAS